MNWKNVLYLLQVERKSGRLVRGVKATRYHESGILAYWPYWVAVILGVLGGLGANWIVTMVYADAVSFPGGLPPLGEASLGFFASMPTLILILSFVFTLFQQIQLSGIKKTSQVMYWMPVTWQEHTLASILANLFGLPLALAVGSAAGLIVFGALNGLVVGALVTTVAIFAAAFMGSVTTEIARVLQVRFIGAVYKSSGKAAVWVRLIGSLLFFLILYLVWFSIFTGNGSIAFIQGLATFQTSLWFIPYVWLGVTLYYLFSGSLLLGLAFITGSALFIAALYYVAILLNKKFGLYEPPAIKVQTSGVYTPKAGLLGKLGFSTLEAAIIRKDIRAFTRRRELMSIFIVPIVFMIVPIFNAINTSNSGAPIEVNLVFEAMIFFVPAALMAMTVGNMLIGEEGPAVWRIYASPVSPKSLVKSKFAFTVILSIIILIITGTVGIIFFKPSATIAVTAVLESLFMIFALGAIGLTFGFKGADFTASHRQRMIRQEWALVSLAVCAVAGIAILAPIVPYALSRLATPFLPFTLPAMGPLELAVSITVSGVIAAVFTAVFYRINLNSAKELIRKAEI
jgi:hypothetical protein